MESNAPHGTSTGADAVRPAQASFVLPPQLYNLAEVHRAQRDLEKLEESVRQQVTRQSLANAPAGSVMPVSEVLQSLAAENTYNLDQPADRQRLASELMAVSQSAPIVHISLAADPPMSFVVAITSWLRANVHPLVLVRIGLQPSIAAGCIVRTTNKVFDMSLRHRFEQNTNKLIQALSGEAQ